MNFYNSRGLLEHAMPYGELRERALRTAHQLIAAGFRRGDRVAVVAETSPSFMEVFFGCQYAGLVPCPVPYSMSVGGKDTYVERIAGMFRSAKVSAAITSPEFVGYLTEAAGPCGSVRVITHGELNELPGAGQRIEPFRARRGGLYPIFLRLDLGAQGRADQPAGDLRQHLRHSRAWAAVPRGRSRLLLAAALSRHGARRLLPRRRSMAQVSVDYLATSAFARRPGLWLKLMSENRCTIAYSPSFGYDLAARRVDGDVESSICPAGGLPASAATWCGRKSSNSSPRSSRRPGSTARAFVPSYGMAEARSPSPSPISTSRRASMSSTGPATSCAASPCRHRRLARNARPDPRIRRLRPSAARPRNRRRNDKGRLLADREIGHILIRARASWPAISTTA